MTTGLLLAALPHVAIAAATASAGAPATGPDELSPAEDNATAASKTSCNDLTSPAGSLVTRRLPSGPLNPDGSLAFRSGVCVYLPPNYETSGLRYPVIYLLHGTSGIPGDWFAPGPGATQQTLDDAYRADPHHAFIAVAIDGGPVAYWMDAQTNAPKELETVTDPTTLTIGTIQNETYVFDHVIPYVDRHFRTIADRRGRALEGMSAGGIGSLRLASRRPDAFAAVGAMSPAFNGHVSPYDLAFGTPALAYASGIHPVNLVPNLDHVRLALIWGAVCGYDAATCQEHSSDWALEQAFCSDTREYRARLSLDGHPLPYQYLEAEGAHTWPTWNGWFRDLHMPYFLSILAGPEPAADPAVSSPTPESFRYRSVSDHFSVYGYEVDVQRSVREFLQLDDVTAGGFSAQGSGAAQILTAPRYVPGRVYRVSGTGGTDADVVADPQGRLTIGVDLGPSHTMDEVNAALQEVPAYWTTRTVGITPAP